MIIQKEAHEPGRYMKIRFNISAVKTHGGWEAFNRAQDKDLDVITVQQGLYICTLFFIAQVDLMFFAKIHLKWDINI